MAGRAISHEAGPFSAAFVRFVIASAFLVPLSFRWRGELAGLNLRQIVALVAMGLTGIFGFNVLFFCGLAEIPASRAALIFAINPGIIAIFSALIIHEKLKHLGIVGISLAVIGALTVITKGQPLVFMQKGLGWGELSIIGAALCWATYAIISKACLQEIKPLLAVTAACVIGTCALGAPALAEGLIHQLPGYSSRTWWLLIYLGILGAAVPYVWFYEGVRTIGPASTGAFISLVPISAVSLSFIILGEPLSAPLLMGAALVTAGLYLTNRKQAPRSQ